MKEDWLWPLKGGTRKEKCQGIALVLELLLLAAGLYVAAWLLAPYC